MMINKIEHKYVKGTENVDNKLATNDLLRHLSPLDDEINEQNGILVITTKAEGVFDWEIENITEDLLKRAKSSVYPSPI